MTRCDAMLRLDGIEVGRMADGEIVALFAELVEPQLAAATSGALVHGHGLGGGAGQWKQQAGEQHEQRAWGKKRSVREHGRLQQWRLADLTHSGASVKDDRSIKQEYSFFISCELYLLF